MEHKRMEWSKEYSIGNAKIDDDHCTIIELINRLINMEDPVRYRLEFGRILSEMTDYSFKHFKKEEAYMKRLSYPDIDEHRKSHRKYIYKVTMFNVDFMNHMEIDPKKVINFLICWWENHIRKADADYEAFKEKTQSEAEYGQHE